MLGGCCSQSLSGAPALTVLLCISSGVGIISRESSAGGGVPLRPGGQGLVHGDGMCLHLALQAVHLLPGQIGEAEEGRPVK